MVDWGMSYRWAEVYPSTGTKYLSVHEMADGFLVTMRWSWPEADIHQEIVFFSPLFQAREIAEEILSHCNRVEIRDLIEK